MQVLVNKPFLHCHASKCRHLGNIPYLNIVIRVNAGIPLCADVNTGIGNKTFFWHTSTVMRVNTGIPLCADGALQGTQQLI